MSKKTIILLFFVLQISVTMSLRFFHTHKKKKKCLVREQWNFHYVTCLSRFQRCCASGCCDSANYNAATTYIRMSIVCGVLVFIFMLVYIEMWCKKKCNQLFKHDSRRSSTEENRAESCHEMQTFYIYNEQRNRGSEEETESVSDSVEDNSSTSSASSEIFYSAISRNKG